MLIEFLENYSLLIFMMILAYMTVPKHIYCKDFSLATFSSPRSIRRTDWRTLPMN